MVLTIAAFFCFLHLTALPIRIWDEARLATSAYEMSITKQWGITTFGWEEDWWSTKPPLMIWLQTLTGFIMGYNELSIRLPSALAAFLIVILLFRWMMRVTGIPPVAVLTSLVFLSSAGFFTIHVARTGDYDALLSLCCLVYLLAAADFLELGHPKFLYVFVAAASAAGMTKGIQGFIFFPAILFLAIVHKGKAQTIQLFIAQTWSVLVLIAYYGYREWNHHGFLKVIWENELGGRYAGVLENHSGGPFYFLAELYHTQYSWWLPFLICSLVYGWSQKNNFRYQLVVTCILFYFLVISASKTKLYWYLAPLYPLMALAIGFLFSEGYRIVNLSLTNKLRYNTLYIYMAAMVFPP